MDLKEYHEFIARKQRQPLNFGFDVNIDNINPNAFEWQKRVIRWSLKRGRASLFLSTGLGKTLCQLAWAEHVVKKTNGSVIVLCPVGVRWQTQREAAKFGIGVSVSICGSQDDVPDEPGIVIANYERMHLFDFERFHGIVMDESSIVKSITSKTRESLMSAISHMRFRLACTATPAPNDTPELGGHAEIMGVCSRAEMQSKYFYHDSGDTSKWRLMPHAEVDFWDWVCQWAACVTMPSDIGGDDTGYILPELHEPFHVVHIPAEVKPGRLFDNAGISATNIHQEKRHTSPYRAIKTAEIVAESNEQCLVWCDTNYEADDLIKVMPYAIEVRGSDKIETKESKLKDFADGKIKVLITKPSLAGMGMNFQQCSKMVFHSISYSFEERFQAIRRCWRFGQTKPVFAHTVTANTENAIQRTVSVKEERYQSSNQKMIEAARRSDLTASKDDGIRKYQPTKEMRLPAWLK